MNIVYRVLILFYIIVLAGCATGGRVLDEGQADAGLDSSSPDAYQGEVAPGDYGYDPGYYPEGGQPGTQVRGGPQATLVERVIYFDFDSAQIRSEYRPVVEAHARYLRQNPSASVVLEGHTDERGTREYNIGLGERRAEAVRRLMNALGVALGQISIVSYGEERPAVAGQDEASYAQNRRVEIVYL